MFSLVTRNITMGIGLNYDKHVGDVRVRIKIPYT